MTRAPQILVFDSGLGGLTVFRALAAARPDARFIYAADDLGFPYGPRSEDEVIGLVLRAMQPLIAEHAPDCVVIACNTASTLVLPLLRARWPKIPFVGTVPAIKPAAERSKSRLISVLATPGTVARDYTRELVAKYAGHCDVALVGARQLATLAEAFMQGEAIDESAVAREIAPCFVEQEGRRTDMIVLACTHYPLLLDVFKRLAPWKVEWIDSAPAIARRTNQLLSELFPIGVQFRLRPAAFVFTSGAAASQELRQVLWDMQPTPFAAPVKAAI